MAHLLILHLVIAVLAAALPPPDFEAQVIDANITLGYGLAIGDVDGDKKPDILLADKKQFVWYRNGDWKRFVLVENLTSSDNVCIAARDIDGDGKVEIAVGAQWNPGETSDTLKSGSVHYLVRPNEPTKLWTPVELHHEPTIHRMKWVMVSKNRFQLVVVPLHGRGNKEGAGKGVKVFSYEKPKDAKSKWKLQLIDSTMHLTHNLDIVKNGDHEMIYIAGKEGVRAYSFTGIKWIPQTEWIVQGSAVGEVRTGGGLSGHSLVTAIQPMHGNTLTIYGANRSNDRITITTELNQGHALAIGSLEQTLGMLIVAGWREPDKEGKVGIKLYKPADSEYTKWDQYWIDDNGMACEDLQLGDLNGDGKLDIIASGRSTHNLKVYWNKN